MSGRMEGKIAVITGATSGIGESTAEVFVTEGAKVVIAGRSKDKGEAIAKRLGDNVLFHATDVMNEQDIKGLIDFAMDKFGRIDCLFNNAGGPTRGSLETVTVEDFDHAMHLLLASVIFGMKYGAAVMKQQKSGCIINTSSIAAIRSGQGGYLYSAAKAAVTHITKIAGVELGAFGIRVNAISPGAVATPIFWAGSPKAKTMTQEESDGKLAKLTRNLANATALKQAGLARDCAMAALYLASEGSYVTCQDIVVDGGRTSLFIEPPRA